jgi:hypothetical protein
MEKIGKKLILILMLTVTKTAFAVDPCSMDFLGMGHLLDEVDQISRAKRYGILEWTAKTIRKKLKSNPGIVENNRRYIEAVSRMKSNFYNGDISINKDDFIFLFRNVEESHISFFKQSEILKFLRLNRATDYNNVMDDLFRRFEQDEFTTQLLLKLAKKNDKSTAKLIKRVKKQIESKARYIGSHWIEYKIHRQFLDNLLKDPQCNKECRSGIRKLKSLIGVSSQDEKLLNPYFSAIESPTLSEIRKVVYSVPAAYEAKVIVKGLNDLKAAIRDILTLPAARRILSKGIVGAFLGNKKIIKATDKVFQEIESITNHYPEIETIFNISDPVKKLDRLRNVNVMFPDDELLVTFARRIDTKAEMEWDILLKAAGENENAKRFLVRMKKAEELAIIKGPLSPDHSRNPFASFVLIIFGGTTFGGYSAFTSTTTEVSASLQDISGDIIEELSAAGIDIDSEEGKSFVTERMSEFNKALKDTLKAVQPDKKDE